MKIVIYLIFVSALVMIFPYRSEHNGQTTWRDITWSIYMILIALDMLSFIIRVRRIRMQKIFEFILYGSFVVMLFYCAITNPNLR
jgi:peptidoglycan/LPS O-acetylase OafA/YrhL